jgi:signal transduction histidine kinase
VRVRAQGVSPERLTLVVEDDGAGLPEDRRGEVLRRGARLDESAPGSGLGLSIIDELARAYGGALRLEDSSLGGLRLETDLPRADA